MTNTIAQLKKAGFSVVASEGNSDAEGCTLVTHTEPFWYYNELQARMYSGPDSFMDYWREHVTAADKSSSGTYSLLVAGQQYLKDTAEFPFRLMGLAQKKVLDDALTRHISAKNDAQRARDDFDDALTDFENYYS
jgi:hypothetical protein